MKPRKANKSGGRAPPRGVSLQSQAAAVLAVHALAKRGVGSMFGVEEDAYPPIFFESAPQGVGSGQPGHPDVAVAGELHTTAGLFDFFFGEPRQRSEPRSERPRPRRYAPSKAAVPKDASAYRTLCVRLCDGFYFPISFSTGRERFAADAKQCERQCPSRSRLFVYRNPGEEIEHMRDLDGLAYMSLPTALMYRMKYVADCNCKPNPWDEAAQARHRAYAENVKKSAVGKVGKKH